MNLEQLITEYGKDIYSFCIHLTGNADMADELYQDTFLVAAKRQRVISKVNAPKGYLLSVAVHIWTNRKRKFARRSLIAPVSSYMEGIEITAPDDTQEKRYQMKGKGLSEMPWTNFLIGFALWFCYTIWRN